MGGLSSFIDNLTGKAGARAATNAANVQRAGYQQQQELWNPLSQFGMAQLDPLYADATTGGYGSNIGDILGGSGFGALVDARQRASGAALSNAGLRRSGAAATEAARIPTDLAFNIEQELNRRRMANLNQGMMGTQNVGAAIEGASGATAGGILGAQQARSQGAQNILGAATSIGGALVGMPGGIGGMFGGGGGGLGSILGGVKSFFGGSGGGNMPQDYSAKYMQGWGR
jgi:hypothetical protein